MKTLPKLRIPWVTRRWHEREAGVLKRQLDGCMEARRHDAERHNRTLKARDAEIAALTERYEAAMAATSRAELRAEEDKNRRRDLESRLGERVLECGRLKDAVRAAEHQRDAALAKLEAAEHERDSALERAARAERQRGNELDQILGLIEAARGRVLECRRADVREGAAARGCAA